MRNFIWILFAGIVFTSCRRVEGSGNIVTERRQVSAFTGLEAGSAFAVEIKQGEPGVEVEADDNLQKLIETRVSNEMLRIRFRDHYNIRNGHYKIFVSMPEVRRLECDGAASITGQNLLKSDRKMIVRASGAGRITAELDAPEVDLEASGAATLDLKGRTRDSRVHASGGASVKAADLFSENTRAEASGAGSVQVHASVSLRANASGAGNIRYRGGAAVESQTSGAGSVQKEN